MIFAVVPCPTTPDILGSLVPIVISVAGVLVSIIYGWPAWSAQRLKKNQAKAKAAFLARPDVQRILGDGDAQAYYELLEELDPKFTY